MKIAIYGSRRQHAYTEQLCAFFSTLAQAGVKIVMHSKLFDSLHEIDPRCVEHVSQVASTPNFTADAAISIGGDGTFLRTAMWVGSKQIPVLGINTGHLGYLSSATIDELPSVAAELISGNWHTANRSLIEVVSPQLRTWPFALNEVALSKVETASIISANALIDGAPLADYKADGLIVATPTGSTAYNLSVGGPVIQPCAPVWVISPIAAHALSLRPLVVCDSSILNITVEGRCNEFRITLDGRACTLPIGSVIKLRRAPFYLKIITRPGHNFPVALRQKLHWSE